MNTNPARALVARVRAGLVSVRDWIDGRLHVYRRRRAAARLAALAPSSILFVCLGNICRSPYAARALAARSVDGLRIDSSGYLGPGRNPPPEAIEVARDRGIDHGDHVSKLTTAEMLEAQAIFVFDRYNLQNLRRSGVDTERVYWLGDLDPIWAGKRAIADPWGKPLDQYRATFERIDRCVDGLVCALNR
jgi:protein-tyrosine-phosphatase